jgi:hypothetical protein
MSEDRLETGACFCGAIVAEMRGDPFWICYDHDDDCRRAVGGALIVWVGCRPGQFRLRQGKPVSFSKTPGVVRTFCGACGTSISYADEGLADELYLALGFFDHPEHFQPEAHAYWPMKLPWLELDDALPRKDTYSRARDPNKGNPVDR